MANHMISSAISPLDRAILAIAGVSGFLSVIGCIVIIHSFWHFKDLRSEPRRLLLFLSVCDLGQGIYYVLGVLQVFEESVCTAFHALYVFSTTGAFLWTTFIAFYIYWRTKNTDLVDSDLSKAYVYIFHIVSWGYPTCYLLLVHILIENPVVQSTTIPWCFVRDVGGNDVWRIFGSKVPLVICWAATSILYLLTSRRIKSLLGPLAHHDRTPVTQIPILTEHRNSSIHLKTVSKHEGRFAPEMKVTFNFEHKLVLIPAMFLILRVWGVIYRTLDIAADSAYRHNGKGEALFLDRLDWFNLLIAVGDPLQGFANFVIFIVLTERFRIGYKHWIQAKCSWFAPRETPTPTPTQSTHTTSLRGSYAILTETQNGSVNEIIR